MEEQRMTEQESMDIIRQMIHTAKQEQKDDGKGWIIWGWILFVTSLLTYINFYTKWLTPFYFWNVMGIITMAFLLFSVVRILVRPRTKKVRTYTKDLFDKLNIGFFLFVVFIIFAMNRTIGVQMGFSFLIALYGFWILIYGTALNFKPSVVASYCTWGIGFAALFVNDVAQIMLLHALAVLIGYIIPGHMAYAAFRKINNP